MRFRTLCLLSLILLSACVGPRHGGRPHGQRPQGRPAANPDRDLRQCLVDLGQAGARYSLLPDRYFAGGCSATGAVQLNAVGIPISNLGAIKCRTAERLTLWTREAVQSAASAWLDAQVVKIESFGTYSCRPVNGVEGARLSQHAFANAVDISAFILSDGRRITVKDGWNGSDEHVRTFLHTVFRAACRRFNIVIGPDGDRQHYNHFHFDMGPNGPYCH